MKESRPERNRDGSFESSLRKSLRLYREPIVFILIALWTLRQQFRQVLPRLIPGLLVLLATIEILGPGIHLLGHFNNPQSSWIHLVRDTLSEIGYGSDAFSTLSSFALFISATVMATSYHRQQRQAARESALLSSVGEFIEEREVKDFRSTNPLETQEQTLKVLSLLVTVLRYDSEQVRLTATLFVRNSMGFVVYAQVPEGEFSKNILLDSESGFVARVSAGREGDVMYVPYLGFGHGLRISPNGETHFVPGMIPVDIALNLPSRSTVGAKIHIPNASLTENANVDQAVLVLSASRPDFMTSLDFHAVRITAALIADVFRPAADMPHELLWRRIVEKSYVYRDD